MRVKSLLNYIDIKGLLATTGFWLLAAGCWLLIIAAGLWLLAFGFELFL
jgi:hypothetical protein